jgi:hypothetical protein
MLSRLIFSTLIVFSIAIASIAISHLSLFPKGFSQFHPDDGSFVDNSSLNSWIIQVFSRRSGQWCCTATRHYRRIKMYRRATLDDPFVPLRNPWTETEVRQSVRGFGSRTAHFPLHRPERGPDGKVVVKDGLQLKEQDLHLGIPHV